jgi:hypothetical protein
MRDVMLGGFAGVVMGVMAMAAGGMGVMGGDLMVVLFVIFRRFAMMAGGLFMMLGGAVMMGAGGVLVRHGNFLRSWPRRNGRGAAIKRRLQEAKVSAENLPGDYSALFTKMLRPAFLIPADLQPDLTSVPRTLAGDRTFWPGENRASFFGNPKHRPDKPLQEP